MLPTDPPPSRLRRTRYGMYVSPELDAEIDALRARVAELEAQLRERED